MSLRLYLIFMTMVSVCAWIAWLTVLHAVDPTRSGFLGFVLFYLAIGMAFLSSMTLFGTLFRVWLKKNEVVYRHVVRSLRQALLLTALFLTALMLTGLNLLVWWVMILLILIFCFFELFFLARTEPS